MFYLLHIQKVVAGGGFDDTVYHTDMDMLVSPGIDVYPDGEYNTTGNDGVTYARSCNVGPTNGKHTTCTDN